MKKIIELIKLHKFYSITMILSVAVTISFLMSIYLFYAIHNEDVGPEVNRSRSVSMTTPVIVGEENGKEVMDWVLYNQETIDELLKDIEGIDFYNTYTNVYYADLMTSIIGNSGNRVALKMMVSDENIWRMLSYKFIEGRPFSKSDIESQSKVVVISEIAAFQLFGRTTDIVGETISIDNNNRDEYKVIGLVENISSFFTDAFYDVWFPIPEFGQIITRQNSNFDLDRVSGRLELNVTLKHGYSTSQFRSDLFKSLDEFNRTFLGGEEYRMQFGRDNSEPFTLRGLGSNKVVLTILAVLLVIMLVIPVINGFGISSSYISSRISEIAIRKVYGANDRQLITQLIVENVLITLIGAAIGLGLSSMVTREVLTISSSAYGNATQMYFVPMELLFNLKTIFIAVLFTVVFNTLSVYIPARRATRQPISTTIKGD
ncbi:MAG: ABC transporter permease [Rikenellaceae bacterium]